MLHLLKYHLKINLRDFNVVFWPLIFPILLGTLFYFSFGTMKEADFEIVPVAVVNESGPDNGQSDEAWLKNLCTISAGTGWQTDPGRRTV